MTEVSYPFNADNSFGGTSVVSEAQWQQMAARWGGDRIDYTLAGSATSADLPFRPVLQGRDIVINPGRATVGGFYYQLTSAKTLTIDTNGGTGGRKDLIVVRADMSQSAVTLAVLKGTPGTTPVPPALRRTPGGIWEMPLHEVTVPAKNGTLAVGTRAPYPVPAPLAAPWNAQEIMLTQPPGTFGIDMDSNNTDTQTEHYRGRDALLKTRTLGKSLAFTPNLVNATSLAASSRNGRWRWIAPNMVWFSILLTNSTSKDVTATRDHFYVTLPTPANNMLTQTVAGGFINNDDAKPSPALPNLTSVTGYIFQNKNAGTSNLYLYAPNANTTRAGLDGLRVLPRHGHLSLSGVYEAAAIRI